MVSSAWGTRDMMTDDIERTKLERLTFFSDAVFAIAMTLLVIDVRLPEIRGATEQSLAQGLLDLLPNYIGFVVSFLVIGRFWMGHHRLMGMIRAANPAMIRANLALLMAIAFMPFPTAILSGYAPLRVSIGFYTAYLLIVGFANMRLIHLALRQAAIIDEARRLDAEQLRRSMWAPLAIAWAGFVAGMISPFAGLLALTIGSPVVLFLFARFHKAEAPAEAA